MYILSNLFSLPLSSMLFKWFQMYFSSSEIFGEKYIQRVVILLPRIANFRNSLFSSIYKYTCIYIHILISVDYTCSYWIHLTLNRRIHRYQLVLYNQGKMHHHEQQTVIYSQEFFGFLTSPRSLDLSCVTNATICPIWPVLSGVAV